MKPKPTAGIYLCYHPTGNFSNPRGEIKSRVAKTKRSFPCRNLSPCPCRNSAGHLVHLG